MSNSTINRAEPAVQDDDLEVGETLQPEPVTDLEVPESGSNQLPRAWARVLAVFAVFMAGVMIFALIEGLQSDPSPPVAGVAALPTNPVVTIEPPADSLGIRFDEVRDLWNALDRPPTITQALRKFPEGGGLDSFYHLFDTAAVFAGAIDRETNYLAGLMVRSNIGDPDTPNMYLHLCQIVQPFTPGCIDNYFAIGLDGKTLEELEDGYHVSWTDGDFEWRVTVEDGLQTIRVLVANAD